MKQKTLLTKKIENYRLKGLNYSEISKLLDISPRTVQRYVADRDNRKRHKPQTTQQKDVTLHEQGFSYSEIAEKLNVSRTTVYLWNKKHRAEKAV